MKKIVLIFVFLLSTVSLTSALDESWSEWSNYWKIGNIEELLSVEINSNTTTVYEGDSVQFFCNVSGDVSQYTYYWNFGEESTSYEQNPTYNFSNVGNYTCILTVTDSMYVSISDSIVIYVNKLPDEDPEDNDSDEDGVHDEIDNCPNTYNPGQEDSDNDGIGGVCDEEEEDDDEGSTYRRKRTPVIILENETENSSYVLKNDILLELCMFRVCVKFPFLFVILSLVTTETLMFKSR